MAPKYLPGKRFLKFPVSRLVMRGRAFIIQSLFLFSVSFGNLLFAQGNPSSNAKTTSVRIVGVVPAKLEMNFTFSAGNTVDLVGNGGQTEGGFEVMSGGQKNLGFMNVKSNLLHGYTITAYSENSGSMKNLTQSVAVPYKLRIDDRLVECRDGVFRVDFMGKSPKEGDSKPISLQFAEVPDAALRQVLLDRLVFSIDAN
jgi:hypothetical protein